MEIFFYLSNGQLLLLQIYEMEILFQPYGCGFEGVEQAHFSGNKENFALHTYPELVLYPEHGSGPLVNKSH